MESGEQAMKKALSLLLLLAVAITLTRAEPQPLSFSPESGTEVTVWTNETTHSLVFNVTAMEELDVNLSSASPYVSLNTSSAHLLSGETAPVEAQINVSKLLEDQVAAVYATIWANGTITSNSSNFSIAYLIRISVEEPRPPGNLSFSPYPLSVTIPKGNKSSFQITIVNNHPVKITIDGYTSTSVIASFGPVPTQIVPGGLWTFHVTISAQSLDVGNYSDILTVNYAAEGYSANLYADLPIRIRVVPPPEPPKQPPNTYRVQLTFLDNRTGLAIKGVRVILSEVAKNFEYTATTGDSGSVTFQAVEVGVYTLEAIHPSYQYMVTSIEVHDNLSKVFLLSNLQDEENANQSNQTSTQATTTTSTQAQEQKGMIGLPYNSKTINISPGDDQTFYILVSAEGGSVGPIQILPSSSVPNWISLSSNWTYLGPGGYAALTLRIAPPLDVPPGRYSRQFQILGGRNPVSLTITAVVTQSTNKTKKPPIVGVVTNQSSSGYYSYAPSSHTNVDGRGASSTLHPIPRVIVKLENGTAVPIQQPTPVQKGQIVYVVIEGDWTKVNYTASKNLARFADETMVGRRTLAFQVLGTGDLNIWLKSQDEFGNIVKAQPPDMGFGVYRFQVTKTVPKEQVLITVNPVKATVGRPVAITAYYILTGPGGSTTQPYTGIITVTDPENRTIPIPLGLDGVAEYIPSKQGKYLIAVPDKIIARESVTRFEARAVQISGTIEGTLRVGEGYADSFPAKFASSPKCWVEPPSAVQDIRCNSEGYTVVPAEPGAVFTLYARGPLAESYDVYESGSEVVFALKTRRPVEDTLQAGLGRITSSTVGWMYENWFWLLLGGLIVFAIIRKRLTSPVRKFRGRGRAGGVPSAPRVVIRGG